MSAAKKLKIAAADPRQRSISLFLQPDIRVPEAAVVGGKRKQPTGDDIPNTEAARKAKDALRSAKFKASDRGKEYTAQYNRSDAKKKAAATFSRSAKGKECRRRCRNLVIIAKRDWLLLFAGPGGKCRICMTRDACEIDHIKEHMKGASFSSLSTLAALQKEVERNENGKNLQSLCNYCHHSKHGGANYKSYHASARKRVAFVNAEKRRIRSCQWNKCSMPEIDCVEGNESLFHFNHLHPKACIRTGCSKDPSLRKRASIALMVVKTGEFSMDVLVMNYMYHALT